MFIPSLLGAGADPLFDRPIFIISLPRSGSTLLFETLARSPELFTIGGESHELMEKIPAIHPASQAWASNCLGAAQATRGTADRLRSSFYEALFDRTGQRPQSGRVRMLEKTPKNALRIPFLASVFPDAIFVSIHREMRPNMASMIQAWKSGRFRTYPDLPGWKGPPWSLLLAPNWQSVIGRSIPEIVVHQWATATRIMLDDLAALPAGRWIRVDYETLLADPEQTIGELREALGIDWDQQPTQQLPLSRSTLTKPSPEKWRVYAQAIETAISAAPPALLQLGVLK